MKKRLKKRYHKIDPYSHFMYNDYNTSIVSRVKRIARKIGKKNSTDNHNENDLFV